MNSNIQKVEWPDTDEWSAAVIEVSYPVRTRTILSIHSVLRNIIQVDSYTAIEPFRDAISNFRNNTNGKASRSSPYIDTTANKNIVLIEFSFGIGSIFFVLCKCCIHTKNQQGNK